MNSPTNFAHADLVFSFSIIYLLLSIDRFGFVSAREKRLETSLEVPDEAFMVLELETEALKEIGGSIDRKSIVTIGSSLRCRRIRILRLYFLLFATIGAFQIKHGPEL